MHWIKNDIIQYRAKNIAKIDFTASLASLIPVQSADQTPTK
jgi:hypothetical protein